jgi:ADP-ribose pyrophosphatase
MHEVTGLEVDREETFGAEGGFLAVRRVHLRNVRADGSRSAPYINVFVYRARAKLDAVVVVVWHRTPDGRIEVLLREGLRPTLALGRPAVRQMVPDPRAYLYLSELVAGICELADDGEDGLRTRAAAEVLEEAGYLVAPSAMQVLGAGSFPSPGAKPEKFFYLSVEIADPSAQIPLEGDGSPMEEGARTRWMELDAAIDACVGGEIEDSKTELGLRRLRDVVG